MADSPFIIDVTRENFEEVIAASFKVPVLMDFWASWCQPCLALMPVLARLTEAYRGRFLLAKLNTEEQQQIAAQFGIRSIPTVKLFRDGQPVDEFMGALPESAVRDFLDRHLPRASDATVDKAQEMLRKGNAGEAATILTEVRQSDPDNPRVTLALAQAQAALGDAAAAQASLDALPADQRDKPEAEALRSQLYFETQAAGAPAVPELEARLATDSDDLEALFQLALRKVLEKDYETAMNHLLSVVQKDRCFGDDAGRRTLLKVFELLGKDPLVSDYRTRLARVLH